MKTILVESHAVEYVHLNIIQRTGALYDPVGAEGTAYLAAQMLLRGTRRRSRAELDEALDQLGADLDVSVGRESVVIEGEVLSRNLEPFVALVGEALREPSFDESELGLIQRLSIAELEQIPDADPELCAEMSDRHMWGRHPYGRPVKGTLETLPKIGREDVVAHHERHLAEPHLLVAAAGDVDEERLTSLLSAHLSGLSGSQAPPVELPAEAQGQGIRALLVDKPDRTQTHVRWGHPCIRANHPDMLPLMVGNTVFGGTFTARLMQEIREKRGWSYGAYSRLYTDRRTGSLVFSYFPAVEDTLPALALGQELFGRFVDEGVTEAELEATKSYLVNAFAFMVETPARRMWQAVQTELLERPADFIDTYTARVAAVTRDDVNRVVRAHLRPDDLSLTVVCTAEQLQEGVAALPGVREVRVVPYDVEWQEGPATAPSARP